MSTLNSGNGVVGKSAGRLLIEGTRVDRFFDDVMVMADEPLIRNNRLALLKALGDLMNQVADISKLV